MDLRDTPPPDVVRHRHAQALGLTPDHLRGPLWTHPSAGFAVVPWLAHDLATTCRGIQLVLPEHAVWTHATAAMLRGLWLPGRMARLPLVVSTDGEAPHHDRRGVYVRRCEVPRVHRQVLDGVRIASAAWTVAELAEDLGLIDLVVVIDPVLHLEQATLPELWAVAIRGRRGVRTLRQALQLADGRSESAWETILRLLHVLSEVTDVHPQYVVEDSAGLFVARADLRVGRTRRLHEYDGGIHRDVARHHHDLDREKRLHRAGWDRHGYTASEIVRTPEMVVRDAEHALGREFDARQLVVWRGEVQRSSLSAAGRARLERRLARFDRRTPPRSLRARAARRA